MTAPTQHRKPQLEPFVPYLTDFALRDQRETMERPFFSLSKKKRLKPIDYTSPDGSIWVKVEGHQSYGMATIWDADILMWAAAVLTKMKEREVRPLPRTLRFHPYALLKAIAEMSAADNTNSFEKVSTDCKPPPSKPTSAPKLKKEPPVLVG